jgi:hypothetical protein
MLLRCHKDITTCSPCRANEINSLNDATKEDFSVIRPENTLKTDSFLSNFIDPFNKIKGDPNKPYS